MKQKNTRRQFLAGASGAAGMLAFLRGCTPQADERAGGLSRPRPNILLILADDLGYGDLACYGATDIRSPAIDGLAAEGVRFTGHYSAGAECTPTRTALFTGRYLQRAGGMECAIGTTNVGRYDDAIRLAGQHELGLPVEQAALTEGLKAAGYRMAVYGKWHLGYERKFLPLRHGFEHFVGILGGHCDYFHHTEVTGTHTLYENDKEVRREQYMTDLITEESVKFLRRQELGKPFFLYASYTAPHSPYQGPDDRSPAPVPTDKWNTDTWGKYAEMIERMDAGVAKLLATLQEKGLADNTLVIFASDNGANRVGSNAPFRGHKSSLFEGGIRVPCIARWPGVLAAGKVADDPVITMDLTASMLRAAGAGAPKGRPLDGVDVLGRIARAEAIPRRPLFWTARRGEGTWQAARDGSLKLVTHREGEVLEEWLFDLAADPGEKDDLLAKRPADAARLRERLTAWRQSIRAAR